MRLYKLLIKLSQMGSIFIEIFDVEVLNSIYPMVYISKKYGSFFILCLYRVLLSAQNSIFLGELIFKKKLKNIIEIILNLR